MSDFNIILPSKPRAVKEEGSSGTYEIDGLYPGYGHTLGNSLRRIILSSLPGAAVTGIKLNGVEHEFSTVSGIKEDVVTIILNLKRVRFALLSDEPQTLTLSVKGIKKVTAGDIEHPGQVIILNPEQHIATLTEKSAELLIDIKVEKGLGYIPKEVLQKDRVEIGQITLDAIFSPIRRVNYEVENMRVGDRTDFNRLRILIETNGAVGPREALERSIEIMIHQLKSVIGFQEEVEEAPAKRSASSDTEGSKDGAKTKIEDLNLGSRITTSLTEAGIKSVAGLVKKTPSALRELDGIGDKAVAEISEALAKLEMSLKGE